MAFKVVMQRRAEQDLAEAFNYIYGRAPEPALRWYGRLRASVEQLDTMPARYERAPESEKLGYDIRQMVFGKRSGRYRIIFRIVDDLQGVHVLAIRHGARAPIELND